MSFNIMFNNHIYFRDTLLFLTCIYIQKFPVLAYQDIEFSI